MALTIMLLLDGKKLRDLTIDLLKKEVEDFSDDNARPQPVLAIIQVGDLSESNTYIGQKKLYAEKIGAKVLHRIHPDKVSEDALIKEIEKLNKDESVHGIILQLPIPPELNEQKIIEAINPAKDVDGMTAMNMKRLIANDDRAIVPATVLGVISLLEHYKIQIEGKKVVVVGRSLLVGRPLALELLNKNATVTVCHTHTENLKEETKHADILIVATGSPHLITREHVNNGQVIVDVGISVDETAGKHMVGDVDFEAVKDMVSAISPVPGGAGPMTVASLLKNLVEAWKAQ